ncbi:MAG: PIN domain-containing protein [Thermoleophilaceae bacterium]|nr:PIN domain-containing protein [Thermoleophilaceae bacterium]
MGLLIDTDLLIDLERGGGTDALRRLVAAEDSAVSVITMSELLHGVLRADAGVRSARSAFVERLLASMRAIPITEPVARAHADVWADVCTRGEPIGTRDLWIAATALAHGFGVATRNRAEFDRVPGLRVVSPG